MAKKKRKAARKKTAAKKSPTRQKKKVAKKRTKKSKKKVAKKRAPAKAKRPRGRPRKHPPAGEKPRCKGTKVDGQPCQAAAVVDGYCGRHKGQIDKPSTWQQNTIEEIERRKQFALMRKRELEVQVQEGSLVDTSLATMETVRVVGMVRDQVASIPARRSHELAATLGVGVGDVAAALERLLREELKQIADSL